MDTAAVLAAFNNQIRQDMTRSSEGEPVERDAYAVRRLAADGWNGVTWSTLDDANAKAGIEAQIARFGELGRAWEWKHYSYDEPADLSERLLAAGFIAEDPEALLVAEIAALPLDVEPPAGVRLAPVSDQQGIDAFVAVHDEVFGGDHAAVGRRLAAGLRRQPSSVAAVVAYAGDVAISSGRVEFHEGTDFASLWGGGTLAPWRRRGVFRSVVAHRAALAAARGYRILQVDASDDSRPILKRLGFVELATTTPFRWEVAADQA
jgi:ribosomal protein S18 acetylase RimI-like enzyme